MLDHLRSTGDEVQKADVAKRVGELAERFAPDTQWFIDTMNQARPGAQCGCLTSCAQIGRRAQVHAGGSRC